MAAIEVGNKIDKATRKELTKFIKSVFICGSKTNQEGETIRHALSMFSECQEITGLTVKNCTFKGIK